MKKVMFTISVGLLHLITVNAQMRVTNFRLKNTAGKTVSLDDFKSNKGIILTFITNDCPVVKLYDQRIINLQSKYYSTFPVIAINPVDNLDAMKTIAAKKGYNFNYLSDETQGIAKAYGIKSTTHTFVLVNSTQGLKIIYEGAIDNDYWGKDIETKYVENAIDSWLINGSVAIGKTKAIGCPITYR